MAFPSWPCLSRPSTSCFLHIQERRFPRLRERSDRCGEPGEVVICSWGRGSPPPHGTECFLQPRHEAAAGLVQPRPPAIIVVTEVVDVGCPRLDRHGFGGCDVVDLGRRHRKVDRPIGVRIVNNMHFGAEHIGRKCRPAFAQTGEPNTGGIKSRTASAVVRRSPRCACGSICANSSLNTCQGRFESASDIVERFTGVAPRDKAASVARHPRHDLPQLVEPLS